MANWIKDIVDRKRAEEARQRAIALIALGSANPTAAELRGFTPGVPIDPQRNVTGSTATPGLELPEGVADPALVPDLQQELRNEELQRATRQNAPAVGKFRQSLAFADAGLNENTIAQAQVHRAQAAEQEARNIPLAETLANPDANPLLKLDVANRRDVFQPKLVKVKRKDGAEVYMHETPTLSGTPTYSAALDENGEPLRVPVSASPRGAAGPAPTALQKNAAFLARVMFADDPDAEKKAVAMLTTLKGKAPGEAWDSLTREVSKMSFGRYAKDPQRLFEKTAEIWRVARPMEQIPAEAPGVPMPSPAAAAAPSAGTAARAGRSAPAPTNEPTAINPKTGERLVFRNGQWQPHK